MLRRLSIFVLARKYRVLSHINTSKLLMKSRIMYTVLFRKISAKVDVLNVIRKWLFQRIFSYADYAEIARDYRMIFSFKGPYLKRKTRKKSVYEV